VAYANPRLLGLKSGTKMVNSSWQ